ncbi:MAG: RHS repeat-associated core domain-containing protein, partial [Oscillospiraceae bacterium]|nr:RHS repeat-associated core domain-containing protein [Oscillospiraceae bacterium]
EADPVPAAASAEPDGESVVTTEAAALSDREGQRLVSTQTVQHDYLTLNGKVARETIAVDGTVTTVMDFIYDESGRPFALKYSDDGGESFDTYYYVLNLQGDVVKLVWYIPGFEYKAVATYTYDAWGNVLTATGDMAEINPLRYRGYYFDSETGFYYLQSRYYDPVNHRFINADAYASTGQGFTGTNMFAYCLNSPIICADYSGYETVVVIYDGRQSGFLGVFGKGFKRQSGFIISDLADQGYDVIALSYTTMDEFVEAWNSMSDLGCDVYRVYIVGHGAPGSLDCAGKRLRVHKGDFSYNDLECIDVEDALYLFCCNGGTVDEFNTTTAENLAERVNCKVWAANAGVNISWWSGRISSKGTWSWFYPRGKGFYNGSSDMLLY